MTAAALTPTQHAILAHAHDHTDGCIEWFPSNINGGARQKVLDGLAKRALIRQVGKRWRAATEAQERRWCCRCATSRRCGARSILPNSSGWRAC